MARRHRRGDGQQEGRASGEETVNLEHAGEAGAESGPNESHRDKEPDEVPDELRESGAPEAGGATSRGSLFGGIGLQSRLLRALARFGRAIEAGAYRRLRDLDRAAGEPVGARGRPNRVRGAALDHRRDTPHPV